MATLGESATQNVSASGEENHNIVSIPFATTNFPDYKYTPELQAERMTYHGSYNWATVAAPGTPVLYFELPGTTPTAGTGTLNLGSALQADPFINFMYFRSDIKVKFDISASKFSTGKLVCGIWSPINSLAVTADTLFRSPHAIVDATGGSSVTVYHPYVNPQEAVSTTFPLWTIYANVLQQLQVVTGSGLNVSISVSVSFPNARFFVPRTVAIGYPVVNPAPSLKILPPKKARKTWKNVEVANAQGNSIAKYNTYNLTSGGNLMSPIETAGDHLDATNDINPTLSTAVGVGGSTPNASIVPPTSAVSPPEPRLVGQNVGAVPSTSRDKVGLIESAPNNSGSVPLRRNSMTSFKSHTGIPWKKTTGEMDLVGSMMDPLLVTTQTRPNYNSACNIETVQSLRIYPGAESLVTEKDAFVDYDQMRFDYLVRQPSWITTFNMTTSTAGGTRIASFPIHPTYQGDVHGYTHYNVPNSMGWMCLLSYYSTYWTGDIDFTFLFGSSAFTTGKLMFCFEFVTSNYAANDYSVTNLNQAASHYNVVYDLASQDKRLTLRVPFMSPNLSLQIKQGPGNAGFVPTPSLPYCNGTCNIFVLNPMTVNTGAPHTLEIEMFACGGPNFQLSGIYPFNQPIFVDTQIHDQLLNYELPPYAPGLLKRTKNQILFKSSDSEQHVSAAANAVEHACPQAKDDDSITVSAYSTDTSQWAGEAIVVVPQQRIFPISSISGERNASLRDLLKSRWLAWHGIMQPASASSGAMISVNQVIPTHFIFAQCPYTAAISSFYSMRGSLRLTFEYANFEMPIALAIPDATAGVSNDYSIYGIWAQNLDDVMNATTPFAIDDLARTAAASSGGIFFDIAGHPKAGGRASAVRQFKLDSKTPSVTLEIPYDYPTRTFPIGSLQTYAAGAFPTIPTPWGFLYFWATPTDAGAEYAYTNIYAGVGDDFRLCYNWGEPLLSILGNSNYLNYGWDITT